MDVDKKMCIERLKRKNVETNFICQISFHRRVGFLMGTSS